MIMELPYWILDYLTPYFCIGKLFNPNNTSGSGNLKTSVLLESLLCWVFGHSQPNLTLTDMEDAIHLFN